jgi:hypothetical protein
MLAEDGSAEGSFRMNAELEIRTCGVGVSEEVVDVVLSHEGHLEHVMG